MIIIYGNLWRIPLNSAVNQFKIQNLPCTESLKYLKRVPSPGWEGSLSPEAGFPSPGLAIPPGRSSAAQGSKWDPESAKNQFTILGRIDKKFKKIQYNSYSSILN